MKRKNWNEMKKMGQPVKRLLPGVALGLVIIFTLLIFPIAADGPDSGYVVVVFPGEHATVRQITFTAPISRIGALRMAGYEVAEASSAVCSINSVGCPASDCFCSNNWWANTGWDDAAKTWDTTWPPYDMNDGDIAGFRWSNTGWGGPLSSAQVYTAAARAIDWLETLQQADGGYGGAGPSAEVLMAAGANGMTGATWQNYTATASLGSYIFKTGPAYSRNGAVAAAASGKLALALAAGGGVWPGGVKPMAYYSDTIQAYNANPGVNAWAILGTAALSQPVRAEAVQTLKATIRPNGGWEWMNGFGTDSNSTALAVQALIAAGEPVNTTEVISGLIYLKSSQNITDAGFAYNPAGGWPGAEDSDVSSTAYAIQAIIAAGQNANGTAWAIANGTTPITYLLSLQQPDGSFSNGKDNVEVSTRQAIPALLGRPLPIAVRPVEEAEETPVSGGTITSVTSITISTGSTTFTDTVKWYITKFSDSKAETAPGAIGVMCELDAIYATDGQPAQIQPGQTYTITVTYDPAAVPTDYPEEKLALYYWNGSIWVKELTSVVDTEAHTITATPNHFSLWSGLALDNVFLPLITKAE